MANFSGNAESSDAHLSLEEHNLPDKSDYLPAKKLTKQVNFKNKKNYLRFEKTDSESSKPEYSRDSITTYDNATQKTSKTIHTNWKLDNSDATQEEGDTPEEKDNNWKLNDFDTIEKEGDTPKEKGNNWKLDDSNATQEEEGDTPEEKDDTWKLDDFDATQEEGDTPEEKDNNHQLSNFEKFSYADANWMPKLPSVEQKNMKSSCEVETLERDVSSVNILEISQQEQEVKSNEDKIQSDDLAYKSDISASKARSTDKDASIINSEYIKHEDSACLQVEYENQARSSSLNVDEKSEIEQDVTVTSCTTVPINSEFTIGGNWWKLSNRKSYQQLKILINSFSDMETDDNLQFGNSFKNKRRQLKTKRTDNESSSKLQNFTDDIATCSNAVQKVFKKEDRNWELDDSDMAQEEGEPDEDNNWRLDDSDESSFTDNIFTDDIWAQQYLSMEQSSMRSSCEIESPEKDLNSLNISETCQQKQSNENKIQSDDVSTHSRTKELKFYSFEKKVIVIMKSGTKFNFCGKLLVKVLYGAVEIYGAILDVTKGTKEVYSPIGYTKVAIKTSKVFPKVKRKHVWRLLVKYMQNSQHKVMIDKDEIQPGTAIVVLKTFQNRLTLFLDTHWFSKLFPLVEKSGHHSLTSRKQAEIVLESNLYVEQHVDSTRESLIVNSTIKNISKNMLRCWQGSKWSCTLIAGGKGVGKSTSVRFLVNDLLYVCRKVVLLDLDPGQSECTPAGCLSYSLIEEPLLGPNFTHLKIPVYQVYLDEVNVAQCRMRYLKGVKMLIERLRNCPILSHLPIVVNTMGFVQSIDWDLAILIIKLIRPSNILQITSKKDNNNFPHQLSKEIVNKQRRCTWLQCDRNFIDWTKLCDHDFFTFRSDAEDSIAETNARGMAPNQKRQLAMLSYLSDIVCQYDHHNYYLEKRTNKRWHEPMTLNINEVIPYSAPFSCFVIIPSRSQNTPPGSDALSVMNGSIVALCNINLPPKPAEAFENIFSPRVLTQETPLCTCYGFGIVRCVDRMKQLVYINTPLPLFVMRLVNCLSGSIPIPPVLSQLYCERYVNTGISMARESRRRKLRKWYKRDQHKF